MGPRLKTLQKQIEPLDFSKDVVKMNHIGCTEDKYPNLSLPLIERNKMKERKSEIKREE